MITRYICALLTIIAVTANAEADSITLCGDVNRDGVQDFIVASRDLLDPQLVWILSGKDGTVLHVLRGSVEGDGFGEFVSTLGDLDGDGLPEIVISTAGEHFVLARKANGKQSGADVRIESKGAPKCQIISSKSFKPLLEWPERGAATSVADRNKDRIPDVILVSRPRSYGASATVRVCSGRDGATLMEVPQRKDGRFMEGSPAVLGDIDGDGLSDFAVGFAVCASKECESTGAIACSGRDGHELWRHVQSPLDDYPAVIVTKLGDADGDGVIDLLVAQQSRWVHAVSGKTGKALYEVRTKYTTAVDDFASSLDTIGDVDGDGVADWVVGANEKVVKPLFDEGYVWLCSGKKGEHLKTLFSSQKEGVDVCGLGDVDGDGSLDIALHIQSSETIFTPESNPIVRVVSTKDGHTIWEKDTKTLRKAVDDTSEKPTSEKPR